MPYTISKASDDLLAVGVAGNENTENRWTLNFGPQHPATHTTLRLVMELDGERIIKCTPHIGYLHSGFEKCMEQLNYNQNVTIVDRMDYSAPIYNELTWFAAAEKLLGIELTPRCKALRTIALELGRLQSHLLCVGAAGLDLGAFTAFLYGFNERERLYDIVEYMSGQRYHTSWARVGGLNMDLPDEAVYRRMVKSFINEQMPKAMDDMTGLLNKNRIFVDRTKGVGAISRDDAVAWGLTGPMARSAGVKRDLRKDEPTLCYADNWDGQGTAGVDFKVPVMHTGDVYSRYLVRLEEMRQSVAIINQLIDNIPGGPVNVSPEGKDVLPPKEQVYSSIEGLIQHFELIMTNRGFEAPKGEVYAALETANGEQGYYIASDGGNRPWRARTRPPCFVNYSVFAKLVEGHMISDAVAILGSINVIAAELGSLTIVDRSAAMPSPFPGMDPYLEHPELWPDVHHSLITGVREQLNIALRPLHYVVRVELRTHEFELDDPASELYLVPVARAVKRDHPINWPQRLPDHAGIATATVATPIELTDLEPVSAHHRFLEIRDLADRRVVTVIEIVSPSNKVNGSAGRRAFLAKRDEVRESDASWFEIDLLRSGTPSFTHPLVPRSAYRAYTDRTAATGRRKLAWPISLRAPLPVLPVPLRPGELDVPLDLQVVLNAAYDRAAYDADADYQGDATPPLSADDAAWADIVLRAAKLRE